MKAESSANNSQRISRRSRKLRKPGSKIRGSEEPVISRRPRRRIDDDWSRRARARETWGVIAAEFKTRSRSRATMGPHQRSSNFLIMGPRVEEPPPLPSHPSLRPFRQTEDWLLNSSQVICPSRSVRPGLALMKDERRERGRVEGGRGKGKGVRGWTNDASKGQQVAIRAYCFELLIANSCDRPTEASGPSVCLLSLSPLPPPPSRSRPMAKIVASHGY